MESSCGTKREKKRRGKGLCWDVRLARTLRETVYMRQLREKQGRGMTQRMEDTRLSTFPVTHGAGVDWREPNEDKDKIEEWR